MASTDAMTLTALGVRNIAFGSDGKHCLARYEDQSLREWKMTDWVA